MRARPRGNLVHYYLDTGGKLRVEIPLGSDYTKAIRKWSELVKTPGVAAHGTFAEVVQDYWTDVIPGKEPRTRRDDEKERAWILKFFNTPPAPIDKIEPKHIKAYLNWRVAEARKAAEAKNVERVKSGRTPIPIPAKYGQVRANREQALISHIWNYARENGHTKLPNPCAGIKGFREEGRDAYTDDELLAKVIEHAGLPLKFAIRLAHVTGQRPSDVLGMSATDTRTVVAWLARSITGIDVPLSLWS